MIIDKLRIWMRTAHAIADLSTCVSQNTGAIALDKQSRILGYGFNSNAKGLAPCVASNPCSVYSKGLCAGLRAESLMLMQCQDVSKIEVVLITHFPQRSGVLALLATRCRVIYYADPSVDEQAVAIWRSAGREVYHLG